MSVLRKQSFSENLETYAVLISDASENSVYFRITDLPDTFSGGKNSFLIQGSDNLVQDTLVKIEIKDSKGEVIYTEPGEGIPEYYEGTSKPVAVYVYPDTAYGPCTITILAELAYYLNEDGVKVQIPTNWQNKYNVRWQKVVNVNPNLPNTSKIRFYRRPKVDITETILPVYIRNIIKETISGSVDGVAVLPSANSNLRTYKGDTLYELYATSSIFSASMEGETISVTGLTQPYSSQIRDIVNDKKLIAFVPYYETSSNLATSQQIVKNFTNGSFQLTYNKSVSFSSSSINTSYAKIKLTDLEAFSGDPARLKIFAKRKADIGNFTLLEDIQLEAKEMLYVDSYSGSIAVDTGIFSSQNIIDDFWLYSNYNRDTFYTKVFDNTTLASSVKLLDAGIENTSELPQRILYYSQSIEFTKDTEYQLDFLPLLSSSLYSNNKIEVYLSGSAFYNPANGNDLGKSILILNANSTIKKYDLQQINFKPEADGNGNLLFAIYQGNWQLSNISLMAGEETNFSPNEITLNVSLPTVINNDEYEFKFEFYDINNNYVPVIVTKDYQFVGGSNLSNVDINATASFLSVRPDSNIFPFGYNNNYDFNEVNTFASVPNGTKQITFSVTKPGLVGNVTFVSAAFDSGGVYIDPALYDAIPASYPGFLTNITSDTPYLSVENFTGSIGNIEVKRIEYTASLGGYQDIISIFKVVEGTPGSDGTNGTQYVITPVSGTAIKNSDPNTYLELQLTKIDAENLTSVNSGNIKLVTGSLNTIISVGNGITAGANGVEYNPLIYAQKINGSLTVTAYDFDQNITVDTITLADITDGLTTGFIEASNGLILKRNSITNTYTPTTTALTASFYDSIGKLYTQSLLITPNYSNPNDQLKYQNGIDDPYINLDYVRTTAGTLMTNNVYANTQGLVAKFTFTEPNTGQQISINEGVAIALDGSPAQQYIIRPISGTAIKNSDPTTYLEVQITKIDGTTLTDLSSGNIKLVTGSLNTVVNVGNGVTAGANGVNYNARFYASKINGSLTVGAYDTGTSTILDTITLADITDGLTTGFIESTNGLILGRNPDNTYTPTNTALSASFYDGLGKLYSSSLLVTPNYSSPNDQLKYQVGIVDSNINLDYVRTNTGVNMSNNVYSNTNGLTVKYTFTDPNTQQKIAATEGIAISVSGFSGTSGTSGGNGTNGTSGQNSVSANVFVTPASQVVNVTTAGVYSAPINITVSVIETGTTYTYDNTVPYGNSTFRITNVVNGTNNNDGTITPTTPSTTAGITTTFDVIYTSSTGVQSTLSQTHKVTVALVGQTGPGVVFTGIWQAGRAYQYGGTRTDAVLWSTTGNEPYDTYYAATSQHTSTNDTNVSTGKPGYGPWESLGTQDYFVAAEIAIFQESFIKNTLNVGSNSNGGISSANITIAGSGSYPYISIGQAIENGNQGYGFNGIFLGAVKDTTDSDKRKFRFSLVSGSSYLKWDGTGQLLISGTISASEGRIGGVTISGSTLYAGVGMYNNTNTGFYLTSASSNIFSLGEKLTWNGTSLFISGAVSASAGAIGGLIINTSSLYIGAGIFSGSTTPFFVSSSGRFSLRDALSFEPLTGQLTISGTVSASAGAIGGVYIDRSRLYLGDGIFSGSTTPFFVSSSGRFSLRDALSFEPLTGQLTISGTVSASAGAIGGVYIDKSRLYLGDGIFSGSTTPFFVSSSGRFSLGDTVSYEPLTRLLKISGTLAADTIDATQISNINFGTSKGVNFASGTIGGWTLANQKLVSANTSMSFNANDASIRIGSGSAGTDVTTIVIRSGNPSALTGTNKTFSSIVDISTSAIAGTYSGNNNISNNGGAGAVNITIAAGEVGTYSGTITNGPLTGTPSDNNLIVLTGFSGYVNVSLLIQIASDSSFTNVIYSTTIGSATYSGPTSNSTIAYSAASSTAISVNFPTATTYYCRLLWNLSSFSTQGSFTINTRTSNIYPSLANDLALAQQVSFTEITDGAFQVVRDSSYYVRIQRSGTSTTMLEVGGAITATGNITAYSSDARLKKNVIPISDALDKIDKIAGVHYEWIDDTEEIGFIPLQKTDTGVIAQDIYEVLPDAVKPAPFDTNLDGTSKSGDNYLTVQYEKIVPLLIEGIKELRKQIKELKLNK